MTDLLPEPTNRKRGAQPGNLNALKHGIYIEGRSVRNTTPIERAQLFDLNELITHIKHYINATYEEGLKNKSIEQYNETLRSMALAAIGLSRLLTLHNQFQNSNLPSDFVVTKRTTLLNLVDYYKKKFPLSIDLSDLDDKLSTSLGE